MWLRGIDGMQLFNPRRAEYEEVWLQELQDAVSAYDEILAHRDFLERGEVMNLAYPGPQDDGVFWSGLRLDDRALVRLTNQGGRSSDLTLEPWPGAPVTLTVTADSGRTCLLTRTAKGVQVAP
jgi:hypothetical protein